MFLKRLTIKGFKSGADSAVREMEPGVTVVVGPNGSGKSSLCRAVLAALWPGRAAAPELCVRLRISGDLAIFPTTPEHRAACYYLAVIRSAALWLQKMFFVNVDYNRNPH